jgi:hypothetical protein
MFTKRSQSSIPSIWLLFLASSQAFQNVVFTPSHSSKAMPRPSLLPIGARDEELKLSLQVQQKTVPAFHRRMKKVPLLSTSEHVEPPPGDEPPGDDKKIQGRKRRVLIGYRLSAAIYALVGVVTLVPVFQRPQWAAFALNQAGGPFMAAGVAYILTGAAENERLGSDTYKRLNLLLAQFGFLWLVAGFVMTQAKPLAASSEVVSNPLVLIASLSALVNGIKGWGYGAKGWDMGADATFLGDLLQLMKTTLQVCTSSIPNITSGIYLAATFFSGYFIIRTFVKVCAMMCCSPIYATTDLGSLVMDFGKLKMLAGCMLTLTDAAKRDRLKGTTFIELNLLSSFVWLGLGGKPVSKWMHG